MKALCSVLPSANDPRPPVPIKRASLISRLATAAAALVAALILVEKLLSCGRIQRCLLIDRPLVAHQTAAGEPPLLLLRLGWARVDTVYIFALRTHCRNSRLKQITLVSRYVRT